MHIPAGRLFAAALAVALAGGFSTASFAAKTLRMSSQWTETTAGAQVDKWWAKEIEARTNGEIRIRIFWEGVLGKAKENLALIQNGSIDLAAMSPGYFPAELPFHSAPNSIPMAMARVEQATELMERLLTEVPEFDEEAKRNQRFPLRVRISGEPAEPSGAEREGQSPPSGLGRMQQAAMSIP